MDFVQAIVLGIIQGLTEFLPISSSAHLRIVPEILEWDDPGTEFSAVIHLGTLIALIIYFRQDVFKLVLAAFDSLIKLKPMGSQDSQMAWSIALGTVPIVTFGLLFDDFIKNEARQLWVIGTSLIVLAIFLFLAEKISLQNRKIKDLNFFHIQWIGLTQALALIPGCSRSGSAIMGGLLIGLNREDSARFSFLLGLPAILGSSIYEFIELIEIGITSDNYLNLFLGISSAFIAGYFAINFFLSFLKTYGILIFVIYRILIGSLILIFLV